MAPSTPSTPRGRGGSESGSPAPSFAAPGTYTLSDVVPGVKIFVNKPLGNGQSEQRKAEILSSRPKPPRSAFAPPPPPDAPPPDERDETEYYVHYVEFNKRLDEWVGGSRLVTDKELEWPKPKEEDKKKGKHPVGKAATAGPTPGSGSAPGTPGSGRGGGGTLKRTLLKQAAGRAAAAAAAGTGRGVGAGTPTKTGKAGPGKAGPGKGRSKGQKTTLGGDVKMESDSDGDGATDAGASGDGDDGDADGDADADGDTSLASIQTGSPDGDGEIELTATNPKAAPRVFSKKQEIEKLRTSGSMTQSHSEVSRVKNLNRLAIGKHTVESWYFSPYPAEYAHLDLLYLCEYCLRYWPSEKQLARHRTKCTLQHPPGNQIYRHDGISFFEIDGARQREWCRNLCLLSKCFLDHKTLYYDVSPFMYYCMTLQDEHGHHLIGYFSKEKESAEAYNVACILTLPQHQRKGYGRLLIEFSYELSRREGKQGSPEKPLSDLGLLGYRAYWQETIIDMLLKGNEMDTSVEEIAQQTSITVGDIQNTCEALQCIKFYKGQHVLHITDSLIEQHNKASAKKRRTINSDCVRWKPPVFSRQQLQFGW